MAFAALGIHFSCVKNQFSNFLVIRSDPPTLSQLLDSLFVKAKNAISFLELTNLSSNVNLNNSPVIASITTIGLVLDILGNLCDGLEVAIFSYKRTYVQFIFFLDLCREEISKQLKSYADRLLNLNAFVLDYFLLSPHVNLIQSSLSCIFKWVKFGIPFTYVFLVVSITLTTQIFMDMFSFFVFRE